MKRLSVVTKKKREIVPITRHINALLQDGMQKGVVPVGGQGWCALFVLHTTAALTTADLDPGTDLDMLDAFEAMIPKLTYRHPHDPKHVPDHILSALIGTSLFLPFKEGALVLGQWQEVVLVELDGPRKRDVVVSFFSETLEE